MIDGVDGVDAVAGADGRDGPSPGARRLSLALLALLAVPGIIGFEVWPLTGWRLFSANRDATQTRWVLEAVDGDGRAAAVDLDDLPLGFRNAEWPMSRLPGASAAEHQAICIALLAATVDTRPGTVEVRIVRDRQTLVEGVDGTWRVEHDGEVAARCTP